MIRQPAAKLMCLGGTCCLLAILWASCPLQTRAQNAPSSSADSRLSWQALPDLPNALGVAGPFVGVHQATLIVAGGANFPQPVWESTKQWTREIFVLQREGQGYQWTRAGQLDREIAYGAAASTAAGVICIGGNDAEQHYQECFLLSWNAAQQQVEQRSLPALPVPLAYAQACILGDRLYVAGGQTQAELSSAVDKLWSLECHVSQGHLTTAEKWTEHRAWPGPPRAFHMLAKQNNGYDDCLYLMGGRHQSAGQVEFLEDCWEYNPRTDAWRKRAAMPQPLAAGACIDFGQSHILALSGDAGALFHRTDALRDAHPGFPKRSFAYHCITDTWTDMGPTPANQVTTSAVHFDGGIVLPSGEVRPRVRTPQVWKISCPPAGSSFAIADYIVLCCYLAALIAIGIYFARQTYSTNDYFRGSGKIPWWAAGCSIFATMLSSLTFTGIPSKAYAQDWVYSIGNMMIPAVAVVAVFVALPFFRKMDATSAYEYLEQRFHVSLRRFGSACFSLFHLFRMAIVMSLTGLALAVATPLTPEQSVLLMGGLSIVYCTIGGVSAVIWTDTLQTLVLFGGALIAMCWMLSDTGSSLSDAWATASQAGKLKLANWQLSPTSSQIAIWVIVLGGFGQNLASYTADQAVVQRYMTTKTQALAARSIWTNALLTIPATLLFFGIGTSLFLFYRAHPERLDPSINTDQIFPLFIAQELPVGISGLIVAAVFAAAQSTISTSMNSVSTTLVTDFIRPLGRPLSERQLLRIAQVLTIALGIAGTGLAMFFVDASIRSLFDKFIAVIGLFMGVLGGLFVLGALFPRVGTLGGWAGAIVGSAVMLTVWQTTDINPYLFTTIGITSCVLAGVVTSFIVPNAIS